MHRIHSLVGKLLRLRTDLNEHRRIEDGRWESYAGLILRFCCDLWGIDRRSLRCWIDSRLCELSGNRLGLRVGSRLCGLSRNRLGLRVGSCLRGLSRNRLSLRVNCSGCSSGGLRLRLGNCLRGSVRLHLHDVSRFRIRLSGSCGLSHRSSWGSGWFLRNLALCGIDINLLLNS